MKKQFYTLLLVLIVSIVQAQNKLPFQLEKQWETAGFRDPESVVLDAENNVLYVSNVNGTPTDKDSNGYISKVSLEGKILEQKWVSEGLNAPKGLAIYKGKLYAADIDKIVEIDINSRRVSTHEIPDATFLNDVSIDKKGNVYVSNTFGFSAIYKLQASGNRKIEKWIEGDQLYMPNGMYATSKHLYVAAWGNGLNPDTYETKEQGFLYRIDLKSRNIEIISKPIGNLDGLSQTLHGFLLTNWLKGELLYYSTQQGTVTSVLDLPMGSADTYFDKKSKTIYIPLMLDNKLMSYQLKNDLPMNKQEILNAYWFRHACKEFDVNQKITDEDFKFILETGRLSPSSFGFEPWHFVVVQDKELRNALKENAWGAPLKLETASHFLLCLSMKKPLVAWDSEYIQNFMKDVQKLPEDVIKGKGEFFENFQKSDFDLTNERKLFDWASKQAYIALGNMMTSAAMIGIDTCPIEGFHQEKTEALLKEKFEVDTEKFGLSYMLAFGYRQRVPNAKTRRPLRDIVSWK